MNVFILNTVFAGVLPKDIKKHSNTLLFKCMSQFLFPYFYSKVVQPKHVFTMILI